MNREFSSRRYELFGTRSKDSITLHSLRQVVVGNPKPFAAKSCCFVYISLHEWSDLLISDDALWTLSIPKSKSYTPVTDTHNNNTLWIVYTWIWELVRIFLRFIKKKKVNKTLISVCDLPPTRSTYRLRNDIFFTGIIIIWNLSGTWWCENYLIQVWVMWFVYAHFFFFFF